MSIKSDKWIIKQCSKKDPMIEPFVPKQIKHDERGKIISYGTSSYGYDVRLGNKFKIFTNLYSAVVDPLKLSDKCFIDISGDHCVLPPNSYLLGHTMEYFRIPRNVLVLCVGKSTIARCGLIINVTPIEPGFEGQVVIEIANSTNLPVKVYSGMGIAQFIFLESNEKCKVSYADRKGKYQGQVGLQMALV